ncbi:MAG: peroxiredoxin, partial [Halobacteria archaeon]|nr:peroxiredoxin [Halobacteria archaeon]
VEGSKKEIPPAQIRRMLETGDDAPDFTAETTQGDFTLSEADSPVVLFFFPKAGSKVCTKEACSFRDSMAEFNDLEATVVGISPNDSLERLGEFAEKNSLDYPLISDKEGEIAELYDLSGLLGFSQKMKRVTYVVDDGKIVKSIGGLKELFSADEHVEGSLEAVKQYA